MIAAAKPSRGLGDSVEKAIDWVTAGRGKAIASKVAGKRGCGCAKRRDRLNKLVPYKGGQSQ